jgi:hypothetical protein
MGQLIGSVADRLLSAVVPQKRAAAACSGSYTFCGGYCGSCTQGRFLTTCYYSCTIKPNCTDTCSVIACDC